MFENISVDTLITIGQFIIVIGGAVAIITKVITYTVNRVSKKILEDSFKQFSEKFSKDLERLSLKLSEYMEESSDCSDKIKRSLLSNSRERINQAHEYYMKNGYISVHTMYSIEEVYKCYVELGGNSFVENQIEDLRALPKIS